jgi:two-component system, OmpR family, sensor histidine kinase CiaH
MGNMFRSALFKLTAVYVAFVMAVSVAFSVVLYRLAVNELRVGFQNQYVRWLTEYRPYGLRQPGNPAAELAARSRHIQAQLLYLNLLVLVVTGVASYLLAKRTLRPIERSHNQQKRFTADVSHELRTPLTALKMDTEVTLLDKKATAAQLRETLQGNLDEAKHMETLVNNLLQLSSLEANQIQSDFARVSIRDIASDALRVVEKLAASKNISMEHTLKDGFVAGDAASLTQLVVILLENAIKYSPKGSTVRLTSSSRAQAVTVVIEDSGPGIPADALPHVFDRFYRADKARSEQGVRGFGLGLSLAKLIADLHYGEIILTSAPEKGTQAIVRLPAMGRK